MLNLDLRYIFQISADYSQVFCGYICNFFLLGKSKENLFLTLELFAGCFLKHCMECSSSVFTVFDQKNRLLKSMASSGFKPSQNFVAWTCKFGCSKIKFWSILRFIELKQNKKTKKDQNQNSLVLVLFLKVWCFWKVFQCRVSCRQLFSAFVDHILPASGLSAVQRLK